MITRTLARGTARPRAFSLVELSVVMVIIGVLAVSAVPAIRSMSQARERGAADEIARALRLARTYAFSTGQMAGVSVSTTSSEIELVRLDADGDVHPMPDALGTERRPIRIGSLFGGVQITSISNGVAGNNLNTVWFSADGAPVAGRSNGPLDSDDGGFTQDATIVVSSPGSAGTSVTVRRGTGHVE